MVKKQVRDVCVRHFLVVGRKKQTEKCKDEKVYKMRVFAKNSIHAKSKFWYFLRRMNKIKKANGEILACSEIHEKNPGRVKTFGIVISYRSRYGHHTLYKEFRSTSLNGAVSQMYSEMAGRHKAQRESLTIIRTTELTGDLVKNCRRAYIRQIVRPDVKFPQLHRQLRSEPRYKTVFQANRPVLFC